MAPAEQVRLSGEEITLHSFAPRHAADTLSHLLVTGRTTFVNTLCGQQVLEPKDADDAVNAHIEEGVRIKPVTVGKLVASLGHKACQWR